LQQLTTKLDQVLNKLQTRERDAGELRTENGALRRQIEEMRKNGAMELEDGEIHETEIGRLQTTISRLQGQLTTSKEVIQDHMGKLETSAIRCSVSDTFVPENRAITHDLKKLLEQRLADSEKEGGETEVGVLRGRLKKSEQQRVVGGVLAFVEGLNE
jgi:chromosome segregation ATPase